MRLLSGDDTLSCNCMGSVCDNVCEMGAKIVKSY